METRWIRTAMVLALLSTAAACLAGGEDPRPDEPAPLAPVVPEPTPAGTPIGDPVVVTFGPEGGSLVSADGMLTLVVPAGAVSAPTEFGVQPITNTAPPSIGGAYRLTPEGHAFDVPLEVRLSYAGADISGTGPEGLGIAFQDHQGLWEWQDDVALDEAAEHVGVATVHLSDWSLVKGMQIVADQDELELGENTIVRLKNCVWPMEGRLAGYAWSCKDLSPEAGLLGYFDTNADPKSWAVQGQAGGSAKYGTIKAAPSLNGANYQAPKTKPTGPLTAVVSVKSTAKWSRLFSENIRITGGGGYRVQMDFAGPTSSVPCIYGTSAITDYAELTLVPAGAYELDAENIVNSAMTFTAPTHPAGKVTIDVNPEMTVDSVTDASTVTNSAGVTQISFLYTATLTYGICTLTPNMGEPVTSQPVSSTAGSQVLVEFDKSMLGKPLKDKFNPGLTLTVTAL